VELFGFSFFGGRRRVGSEIVLEFTQIHAVLKLIYNER
jgi:hypothetical protein